MAFDLIQQRRQEEKKQKFKQDLGIAFIISAITILLLAAAVCFAIYKTNKNNHHKSVAAHNQEAPPPPPPKPKTTQGVVKSVCANTDYKKTCEESILKEVKTKNNATATPMDILRASLVATFKVVDDVTSRPKVSSSRPP